MSHARESPDPDPDVKIAARLPHQVSEGLSINCRRKSPVTSASRGRRGGVEVPELRSAKSS